MRMVKYKDWGDFRRFLSEYSAQARDRRSQLVFRGHADASWNLQTTLDRGVTFRSDEDRDLHITSLLSEFRFYALRLG